MNDPDTATGSPTYVILGGSGGIGSALARRLDASGARLLLAARRPEPLAVLAAELKHAETATVDATSGTEVDAMVRDAARRWGRLDGVANCVGSILLKAAHLTSDEDWQRTLDLNLGTAFAALRASVRAMGATGGSVVLLSSAAARVGLPGHEAIAAAKAGVEGLAVAAAASYASRGIRVNVVAPGLVDTPLAAGIVGNPSLRKASEAMHALGRIGRPEDVASAIAWFLDPAQSWVTGQVLGVDGGLARVRPRASG